MLLSFDSQFCFLPLFLVFCSPVRNFNYFCIFLSFYFVFFANLTFVHLFPVSYSIPCVLYLSSPCCRLGSAEMHLYICICYTTILYVYSWNNFDETMILVAWDWGFSWFLCFRSTGIIQISTPRSGYAMLCWCAHRLEISRSNLALVFDVVETLMMVCRCA